MKRHRSAAILCIPRAFLAYAAPMAPGTALAVNAVAQIPLQPAPIPADHQRAGTAGTFLLVAAFFAIAVLALVIAGPGFLAARPRECIGIRYARANGNSLHQRQLG